MKSRCLPQVSHTARGSCCCYHGGTLPPDAFLIPAIAAEAAYEARFIVTQLIVSTLRRVALPSR